MCRGFQGVLRACLLESHHPDLLPLCHLAWGVPGLLPDLSHRSADDAGGTSSEYGGRLLILQGQSHGLGAEAALAALAGPALSSSGCAWHVCCGAGGPHPHLVHLRGRRSKAKHGKARCASSAGYAAAFQEL